jgi:hypothetical protein
MRQVGKTLALWSTRFGAAGLANLNHRQTDDTATRKRRFHRQRAPARSFNLESAGGPHSSDRNALY